MSATRPEQLYDTDFFAWTQAQAKELRRSAKTRPNLPLDLGHIAETIEDLGMSERSAVFSFVRLIMQHFLLATHSPAADQRQHRLDEVDEFRSRIEDKEAAAATALPDACPYTLEQILGDSRHRALSARRRLVIERRAAIILYVAAIIPGAAVMQAASVLHSTGRGVAGPRGAALVATAEGVAIGAAILVGVVAMTAPVAMEAARALGGRDLPAQRQGMRADADRDRDQGRGGAGGQQQPGGEAGLAHHSSPCGLP
jgi:hypothetical protein